MARPWLVLLTLQSAFAAPAAAQSFDPSNSPAYNLASRPAVPSPMQGNLPAISYRVETGIDPDGSQRRRSGFIAGFRIAPGATVGVGLFGLKPRAKSSTFDQSGTSAKGSRKAALAVSLKL